MTNFLSPTDYLVVVAYLSATMVIGFDETLDERLEHLRRPRDFNDDCLRDGYDGLLQFRYGTYQPDGSPFGGREMTPHEYCGEFPRARS